MSTKITVTQIDALLPQTQCTECGFSGCKPYAEALVAGSTTIDRCPPGGVETLVALSRALNVDATPYLAEAEEKYRAPSVAVIDESLCIGCVKCIKACPVDAIVGAAKLMHTVVSDWCTGCGLCVAPCPMDCIRMEPLPERSLSENVRLATQWRAQHEAHLARLAHKQQTDTQRHEQAKLKQAADAKRAKQAAIAAAIARVNARKSDTLK